MSIEAWNWSSPTGVSTISSYEVMYSFVNEKASKPVTREQNFNVIAEVLNRSGFRQRNPGFSERVKRGIVLESGNSTCYRARTVCDPGNYFAEVRTSHSGPVVRTHEGSFITGSAVPVSLPSADEADLYNRTYRLLADRYRDAESDLMAVLAESNSTIKAIGSYVPRLSNSYDSAVSEYGRVFKRDLRRIPASLRRRLPLVGALTSVGEPLVRKSAEFWLEWQFGVKPLYNDIQELAAALSRIHNDSGQRRSRKVSASQAVKTESVSRATGSYSCQNGDVVNSNIVTGVETSYVLKLGGTLTLEEAVRLGDPFHVAGLSLDDLASLWEGVPWSWLLDYFTNVGDMLRYASMGSIRLSNTYRVTVREAKSVRETNLADRNFISCTSTTPCRWTSTKFDWARTSGEPLSRPDLTITGLNLGPIRSLNLAAVAVAKSKDRLFDITGS